jgi:hypothetical protein
VKKAHLSTPLPVLPTRLGSFPLPLTLQVLSGSLWPHFLLRAQLAGRWSWLYHHTSGRPDSCWASCGNSRTRWEGGRPTSPERQYSSR